MSNIDEAWNKVVAALPEDYYASIYFNGWSWTATYNQKFSECPKCGVLHQCEDVINGGMTIMTHGDTPETALYNLAIRLELRNKREDSTSISGGT
jgi:hypothetical protein